ncbi:hypothetical protein MNBD_BACTEROID07-1944 [hydrothermal vent metagenome]|uniref:Outer membrane protein beta-barrel domain-containing protein n=1 Tax=hydrothermal vent metagenome TaxID=652676 RepID=A0A3B0VCB2_9ZZZZ
MNRINKYLLALLLIFSVMEGFGQGKDSTFFFDTFAASVNMTYVRGGQVNSRAGFGLGLYRTMLPQKRVNLLFGIEYNYTSRFAKQLFKGKYSTAYDVTYSVSSISMPFTVRVNMGKRVKFFLETGVFFEVNIGGREKGTSVTWFYPSGKNDSIYSKEIRYNEKGDISSFNYGFSAGIGISIPMGKHFLIIKPEYKIGMVPVYDYMDVLSSSYFRMTAAFKL